MTSGEEQTTTEISVCSMRPATRQDKYRDLSVNRQRCQNPIKKTIEFLWGGVRRGASMD